MRRLIRWGAAVLTVCALLLSMGSHALAADVSKEQWDTVDSSALEKQSEDVLDLKLDENINLSDGFGQIASQAEGALQKELKAALRSGMLMLLVVLLCSMVRTLERASESRVRVTDLVGTIAVTSVAVSDVSSLMELGRETVERISDFAMMLIPTLSAAAAATGAPTRATVRQAATLLLVNLLLGAIQKVFIPLVYLHLAASAAAAAMDNEGLRSVARLIRWVVTWALTGALLIFTGYLTVSAAAAGAVDATAAKATRFAISGLVPVVGNILSNASETILSGAAVLKNSIGIFGVLAVLAFCAAPFVHLGVRYLLYKVVAALSAVLDHGRLAPLIADVGTAFGLMVAMTGASALGVLISLIGTLTEAVT